MKLNVPFYKQTTPLNCGSSALRMVLAYLGKDLGLEILEEKMGVKEGKGVSTVRLAIASTSLGYKTEFYSKQILFNEKNINLDYYKQYGDMNLKESEILIKQAKEEGVNVQEKSLPLEELLEIVTEKSVPIILLDWNVVLGKREEGYQGHFVPIVGYDDENVYVHNHGFKNTQKFFPINKLIFDKARKAKGTDEDIVVIYKIEKFIK